MTFNVSQSFLAGTTAAARQQWLLDAQTAYAQLMTGGRPVSVSYEGKSVTYIAAQGADLLSWIGLLQASLGITRRARRALRPYFR